MRKVEIMVAALLSVSPVAFAQAGSQQPAKAQSDQKDDLLNLDVMDLAKMQVTSASKKAESLFGVAAAISVVTAEDIKRSGATNIPEALRLVPGVQVAQVNASQYAVSIRGFNSLYSSQLLVLIDGRSIYNNFWGGVYWEDQAINMDEIDRIEVIRGPGGTLWGANAVNGVINIITKQAKDTKGVSITAEGATHGTFENESIRYGGKIFQGDFRVSVLGVRDEQSVSKAGADGNDQRNGQKVSFRYDGGTEEKGKLLVEGDLHRFDMHQLGSLPSNTFPFSTVTDGTDSNLGGSILVKLEKNNSNGSSNSLQASYDHTYHFVDPQMIDRDGTIDVEFQHGFQPFGNNNVIAGASYRTTADDFSGPTVVLVPAAATTRVSSFFAQDQIDLTAKTRFTIGTKVEHNDFSGWEVEPSARIAVKQDENHTWWGSVSRAVSTPNRANTNFNDSIEFLPYPYQQTYIPAYLTLIGNQNVKSTVMTAVETGYRAELNKRTTADLSVFQNSYNHLNTWVQGAPIAGMPVIVPLNATDIGNSTVRGLELSTKFQATDKLRLDLGYSYEVSDVPNQMFAAPKHEIKEMATYTFSDKLMFDQAIYFSGGSSDTNPSYHRMDFQLRYKASKQCDFSIGGRNLGMGRYTQLGAGLFASGQAIQPALYSQLTLKF